MRQWYGTLNGRMWVGLSDLAHGILQVVLNKEGAISLSDFCKKIPYKGSLLIEQKAYPSSNKRYDPNKTLLIDGKTYYVTTEWGGDSICDLEKKAIFEYGCYIERYYNGWVNYAGVRANKKGYILDPIKPKNPNSIPGYSGLYGRYVSYAPWVNSFYVDGLTGYLDDVCDETLKLLESIFPEAAGMPLPRVFLDDGFPTLDYGNTKDGYTHATLERIAERYEKTQCPLAVLSGILRNSNTQWQITAALLTNLLLDSSITLNSNAENSIQEALKALQSDCPAKMIPAGLYTGDIRIFYRYQRDYPCGDLEYMANIGRTLAHELFHAFHHKLAPKEFGKGFIEPKGMEYHKAVFPNDRCEDLPEERRDCDIRDMQGDLFQGDIYKSVGSVKEKWEATVVQEASADFFSYLYSLNDKLSHPGRIYTVMNTFNFWDRSYGYTPYAYALHYMPKFGVQCNDYNSHLSSPNSINKLKKVIYKSVDSMEDAYDLLIR